MTISRTYISLFATALALVFISSSCVENSSKYKQLQAQLDSLQGNYGVQKNMLDEKASRKSERKKTYLLWNLRKTGWTFLKARG